MPEELSLAPAPPAVDLSQTSAPPSVVPAPAPPAPGTDGTPPPSPTSSQPPAGSQVPQEGWKGDTLVDFKDNDAYEKFLDELRNAPAIPAAPAAPAQPPPPPAPAAPAPAPQRPATEDLDDDADTGGLTQPGTERLKQIKYRPHDPVEESILRIAKASGKGITDPGVVASAYALHGLPVPGQAPAPQNPAAQPQATEPTAPTTAAEAQQQIEALTREIAAKQNDFLFEEAVELDQKRLALLETKLRLEMQAGQTHQQQQAEIADAWALANQTAMQRYEALNDANSALTLRANELQAAALQAGGTMAEFALNNPSSLLHFANEAAAQLGITPTYAAPQPKTPAPAPAPPPNPPVSPSQPSSVAPPLSALIAGGHSPAPPSQPTETAPDFRSAEDYERWLTKQSGTPYAVPAFA